MDIQTRFQVVDATLEVHAAALGRDHRGYANHVARVLNFYRALSGGDCPEHVVLAAAFHDLGIWSAGTFDYLGPSVALARRHLESQQRGALAPELEAIILQHHKLTAYGGPFAATVETFRKADLVDVSLGLFRFGLPRAFVRSVRNALPNAGFHRRLVGLTLRQFLQHPLHPLPMVRW